MTENATAGEWMARLDKAMKPGSRVDPELRARAKELLGNARSKETMRAYRTGVRYWQAWHEARYGEPLQVPTDHETVFTFVLDHAVTDKDEAIEFGEQDTAMKKISSAKRRAKLFPSPMLKQRRGKQMVLSLETAGFRLARFAPAEATLRLRLAALAFVHHLATDERPPTSHKMVLEAMRGATAVNALHRRYPRRKSPLTRKRMKQLFKPTGDDLVGLRDRALILVALTLGGLRRSELANMLVEDFFLDDDGDLHVRLPWRKTTKDATGAMDSSLPLARDARAALEAWMKAAGIKKNGHVFRNIVKRKVKRGNKVVTIDVIGSSMSPKLVYRRVRSLAKAAKISEDELDMGAHSLRAGFMTEASNKRVSIEKAMLWSGRKSIKTALTYYRPTLNAKDKAANLFNVR